MNNLENEVVVLKESQLEENAYDDVVRTLSGIVDDKYINDVMLEVEDYAKISKKSGFLQGVEMTLKMHETNLLG